MAREKHVYARDMVAHLWANRHPIEVRDAVGTMFTRNGGIYSYGNHYIIAQFMDTPAKGGKAMLLWNDEQYSNTTGKHKSVVMGALHYGQRQTMVHVPSLQLSDLHGLAGVAKACIAAANEPLERSAKARAWREIYIGRAITMYDSARAIYQYLGNKRAAKAVPVLAPDADRATAGALLDKVARAERIERARILAAQAANAFTLVPVAEKYYLAEVAQGNTARRYNEYAQMGSAREVCDKAQRTVKICDDAIITYRLAKARVPSALRMARDKAASMRDQYLPAANAEQEQVRRHRLEMDVWRLEAALARYQRDKEYTHTVSTAYHYMSEDQRGSTTSIGTPALQDRLAAARDRAALILAAEAVRNAIERPHNGLRDQCHRYANDPKAGVPSSRALRSTAKDWAELRGGVLPTYWQEQIDTLLTLADDMKAQYDAEAAVRTAAQCEVWRRGGRHVQVPYDAPTMVRIVGDTVQTSKGAVVPLAHAVRLVRIAKRVAAAGGKTYLNGEGPTVGAFRTNKIGADLSAIIGCHEFTAEESARAVALIEATTEGT